MRGQRALGLVVMAWAVVWTTAASAQDASAPPINFMRTVRAQGMANAYNAIGLGAGGVYHNPAGIMAAKMYTIDGAYEYTPSGNLLNLTLVDSKLNPYVGAGVGYSYFFGRGDNDSSGHDLKMALAAPVVANRISVGAALRYMTFSTDDIEILQGWTFDVGALIRVVDDFHIGVVGRSLIELCENQARCGGLAPTTVGGGLAYGNARSFVLTGDFELDLTSADDASPIVEVGGEYFLAGMVPLRLGFAYHGLDDRSELALGAGWRTATAGFEAAYLHDFGLGGFGRLAAGFSISF